MPAEVEVQDDGVAVNDPNHDSVNQPDAPIEEAGSKLSSLRRSESWG
jgi:hypothetical protein